MAFSRKAYIYILQYATIFPICRTWKCQHFPLNTVRRARSRRIKKEAVKANELIDGLKSLNELFKSRKIINIGMNYLPFGLSRDSSKDKNALRKEVNELYSKTDNLYYEMIDIDKATRQPENPDLPLPHILCKDKLHPNTLGGEIIADCIPLKLFEPEKF